MYRSENYPETLGTSYKSGSVHSLFPRSCRLARSFLAGKKGKSTRLLFKRLVGGWLFSRGIYRRRERASTSLFGLGMGLPCYFQAGGSMQLSCSSGKPPLFYSMVTRGTR